MLLDYLKIRTTQVFFCFLFNIIGCTIDQVGDDWFHSGSLVDVPIFNETTPAMFSSREKEQQADNWFLPDYYNVRA